MLIVLPLVVQLSPVPQAIVNAPDSEFKEVTPDVAPFAAALILPSGWTVIVGLVYVPAVTPVGVIVVACTPTPGPAVTGPVS